jgi:hypothetical protein
MAATTYRFLPWARRGLADRIPDEDTGGALPARAQVKVGLTISSIPEASFDLSIYGPGDVIGVDTRLIIRTDPRPHSTDVEPNYFAHIEFDPPDFPWLFTPAKHPANDQLRPWCVLVVVDLDVVAAPRAEAGRPLPVLLVPKDLIATELPDLTESWAWAHAQVIAPAGNVNVATELADRPAMNVSRIVAPRRLEPGRRYAACLVPAFDAGVTRGLGGVPDPDTPLGPAWRPGSTTDLQLPVYFHWEFSTGPAGDFEELARRLQPFKAPPSVGVERMYIGAAGPELPAIPPTDPGAYVEMDGALRAPGRASGTLGEIAGAVQSALRATLDAAAVQAQAGPTAATPVLGPPLYGEWHARQHTVPQDLPAWLRELNLDPRTRAAAGLGAEIERMNQEEFMQWCWEQVGRILEANRLLSRARLSLEALARVHARHFTPMPADRLLQLAAPLHSRTKVGTLTVSATIARSSLPNASTDPAMRRLTSAQRPVLRAAMRRAAAAGAAVTARVNLVNRFSTGALEVDPTRFLPHSVLGVPDLAGIAVPATGDTPVDLTAAGLPVMAPASLVRKLRDDSTAVMTNRVPRIAVRSDLRTTGLITEAHLLRARELLDAVRTPGRSVSGTLDEVTRRSATAPGAAALLLAVQEGQPAAPTTVHALDVDATGRVFIRTPVGQTAPQIASIDSTLLRNAGTNVGGVIGALPRNTLDPTTTVPPVIGGTIIAPKIVATTITPTTTISPIRVIGRFGVRAETAAAAAQIQSVTMATPVKDLGPITRVEKALGTLAPAGQLGPTPPQVTFVPFAIPGTRDVLLARTQPRATVPKRLGAMLTAGKNNLFTQTPTGIVVAPAQDRIMAAPEITAPVYEYLARLDPERFLPGVGEIPDEAITLLETNTRFIEALLVGLNTEMNRELLWRAFPTDQRGTPLRHFWAWVDGNPDIRAIHEWPESNTLGMNSRSGPGGQIALLVRGRLLRRYPNTAIFAWRSLNGALKNPPAAADIRKPVFAGVLGADIVFVGFDLTDADLQAGDGWFFVLQEQPTEPRFGFDEYTGQGAPPALGPSWSDATWSHTGTAPGRYLHIAGNPLANVVRGNARFVDHAAHLAAITMQKPMRVAVHARSMITA